MLRIAIFLCLNAQAIIYTPYPFDVSGPPGPTGPAGIQGITGPPGSIGLSGSNGSTGAIGPQGIQGNIGSVGAAGSQGIQGPIGVTGSIGATGSMGLTGSTGSNGTNGSTGATGSTGPSGVVAAIAPVIYTSGTQTVSMTASTNSVNGYLTSADHITFAAKFGSVTYAIVGSARTVNTNFLISSTLASDVCYTTKVSCSFSLLASCEGLFDVRSDVAATPTTSIGTQGPAIGAAVNVGLTLNNGQTAQICGKILPGHNVRIVATTISGSPTFSGITAREITTAFGP